MKQVQRKVRAEKTIKVNSTLKESKVNKKKTIFKAGLRQYALQRIEILNQNKTQSNKITITTISSRKIEEGNLLNTDLINCSICLDWFVYPILTRCGHAFCLHCIQSAMSHSSQCCLCRHDLEETEFEPSIFYAKLIEKLIQNLNPDQKIKYQGRVQEFKDKELKRKISQQISIGDKIDVRNGRTWTEGVIVNKSQDKFIVALGKDNKDKLQFKTNSRNLARMYTFTKKPFTKPKTSHINYFPSFSSVMSSPLMLLIDDAPTRSSFVNQPNLNIRQIETDLARQLIPQRQWDNFDVSENNDWVMSGIDVPFQENVWMWDIPEVENDLLYSY